MSQVVNMAMENRQQEKIANLQGALEIAYDYIREDPCTCSKRATCARCRIIKIMELVISGVEI